MSVIISKEKLDKWANYLINHSINGVTKEDVVMIKGEAICWPLISALQERIIKAGAIVDINIVAPDNERGKVWGAAMAKYGTKEQINKVPRWQYERYNAMTKFIEVLGVSAPENFEGTNQELAQEIMRVDAPIKNIRLSKNWVITLFPTEAFAKIEGMTLEEYADVIVEASTVDPAQLDIIEEDLYQLMGKTKTVKIVTENPKTGNELVLTGNIEGRNIIKCTGTRNFPDGEVYASPDARTLEGEIFVDLPVFQLGATIQGIYLKFNEGKIVNYSAEVGEETLKKIIETDEGSRRIGEIAFGMNNGIKKVLKHPLFVEKVGGTLHIAIGASYATSFVDNPNTEEGKKLLEEYIASGEMNKSAQHVDIVTDFREGGVGKAVYLDDVKLEIENGIWKVPNK